MDEKDLKNALRNTLDNLTKADRKRFRHYLRDQSRIAWGKLERATTDDTVDLMVQTLAMGAGDVMVTILQEMNHNQLAINLERELGKCKHVVYSLLSYTVPRNES